MRPIYFAGLLLIVVACTLGGYFAGREHTKYEMREAFRSAFANVSPGASAPVAAEPAPTKLTLKEPVRPAPAPAPSEAALIDSVLVSKGFREKNIEADEYKSFLLITVDFSNKAAKSVRAFDGLITLSDLLDNDILSVNFAINELIAPASTFRWDGAMEYNQFMSQHAALRNARFENLKLHVHIRKVLYGDGTTTAFN